MVSLGETLCLLLLGHVVGDFYFQSDEMAIAKERSYAERVRHGVFYALGIAPVLVAIAIFLGCPLVLAVGAWIVLFAMHGVIDFMIRPRIKRMTHGEVQAFLLDQALHVGCCVVAGVFLAKNASRELSPYWAETLVWTTSLALCIVPACVLVKLLLGSLRRDAAFPGGFRKDAANSGRAIGMLERAIVGVLTLLGQYDAIAFVVAAKSIARYERLKDDKTFAEVYLVGTLASVAAAIFLPLFVRWAMVL